jgi:hypothetical protein
MSLIQYRFKPELPVRTRLWIYVALWIATGIAFIIVVQFIPGEDHPANEPEWYYHLKDAFIAFVGAPLEIVCAFTLVSRNILLFPSIIYLTAC